MSDSKKFVDMKTRVNVLGCAWVIENMSKYSPCMEEPCVKEGRRRQINVITVGF